MNDISCTKYTEILGNNLKEIITERFQFTCCFSFISRCKLITWERGLIYTFETSYLYTQTMINTIHVTIIVIYNLITVIEVKINTLRLNWDKHTRTQCLKLADGFCEWEMLLEDERTMKPMHTGIQNHIKSSFTKYSFLCSPISNVVCNFLTCFITCLWLLKNRFRICIVFIYHNITLRSADCDPGI